MIKDKFDLFFFENNYNNGNCCFKTNNEICYMIEYDDKYTIQSTPISDFVLECFEKSFYADTLTIMNEGKYLKNGSTRIGVWKTYDRLGEIIEETNYEEGFDISWEKMREICAENQIELNRIVSIERDPVLQEKANEPLYWYIIVYSNEDKIYTNYVFDGKTGEKIVEEMEEETY